MEPEKEYIQEVLAKTYNQHTEEELFEMSNFYTIDTGLPMVVLAMTKQEYKHKLPRLKFQDENQVLFPISIEDDPKLLVKNQM